MDKYAALAGLFTSQNTIQDHEPSIFGNTANGGRRSSSSFVNDRKSIFLELGHSTSSSGFNNSIFGNTPFSSAPQTSVNVSPKFPPQQQQQPPAPQTNMFATQAFPPPQFPPASNPFVQQPFAASKTTNKQFSKQ